MPEWQAAAELYLIHDDVSQDTEHDMVFWEP